MGSDNQCWSYWNVCVGQADCCPLRIEIQVRAIPKLRRAKQFIRAKAAEWVRSILWLDRRATSPPIQEFCPTIVFNAAFDGEQCDGSGRPTAPRPSHRKNGMHASQKLGCRQSTLGPCADRLAAMRLRPSGISDNG